jgi:hypothetical protein
MTSKLQKKQRQGIGTGIADEIPAHMMPVMKSPLTLFKQVPVRCKRNTCETALYLNVV